MSGPPSTPCCIQHPPEAWALPATRDSYCDWQGDTPQCHSACHTDLRWATSEQFHTRASRDEFSKCQPGNSMTLPPSPVAMSLVQTSKLEHCPLPTPHPDFLWELLMSLVASVAAVKKSVLDPAVLSEKAAWPFLPAASGKPLSHPHHPASL